MSDPIREWWRRLSMSPALIRLTRRRVALQWRLSGRPLPPPHVVKQLVVLRYQQARKFSTFIETGTFTGEMVAAMRPHFQRIVSIELSPEIHRAAVQRFAGDPGIELLSGDSALMLPRVLERLGDPALFWLDEAPVEAVTVRRMQGAEVLRILLASTLHRDHRTPDRTGRQLRALERLAKSVPLFALAYPRRHELLPAVADAVRRSR